ncbi:MAG: hypothetical protein NC308_10390 [Clostridium sp.]|nr:hypothetical protein [Bacteroides sp.]MCM1199284.1 hypothetical protein [Clostridium sp.]
MKNQILYVMLIGISLITGCYRDTITISPETLVVGPEVSTAVVETSGFIGCEIIFKLNDANHDHVSLWMSEINEYEGEWFHVTISDDWHDLHFEFKENVSTQQRTATFQLSAGDIFNRFTVIQSGTN